MDPGSGHPPHAVWKIRNVRFGAPAAPGAGGGGAYDAAAAAPTAYRVRSAIQS